MPAFNVFLVDPDEAANFGGRQPTPRAFKEEIRRTLQGFFAQVVASGPSPFDAATVCWAACDAVRPQPWELVIYFVPNSSFNVLAAVGNATPPGGQLDLGWTVWRSGPMGQTGSQVYTRANLMARGTRRVGVVLPTAADIAGLAFHEAMHNKLRYDDNQLHGLQGGSLSRSPYQSGTRPSTVDLSVMRAALGVARNPFTGGCAAYAAGRIQQQRAVEELRGL